MKWLIIVIFLFLADTAFGQTNKDFKIKITPLEKEFYICTSYGMPDGKTPFPSNSLVAVTAKSIVLIDTPWDEDQTQQLLEWLKDHFEKPVALCIATHFHDDRVAGLDVLRAEGIKTYTSKLTDQLSVNNGNKRAQSTFEQDSTFTIDGLKLNTYYPGAGHTPDNIVVWFPAQKILFGGCFIKSFDTQSIGNIADADLKQWGSSINKLSQKYPNAAIVIPGHQGWGGATRQYIHTCNLVNANQ
ncbi:subclass B1 metallo-beta-lactamase [Mucilaginibacter pallidiroseus]|uniref:beta-lactamase n=1 Tax=Mucilaginibacter pallidiroseus TaxID=2599295 RepID=A0A563U3C8_9SPHI|nr:subclass B1 metallo-beta-lactamase [Mucilaginibacter pallidiroseus]TWR25851.1 subclass B1 metallo-beta-lactamase [Mucilaginibacter pallidiroseus]